MGKSPLPLSMWEFSWLVRREGAEAEYSDWDRVLDEAVERGYRCLRIDAFPHLVAAARDGSHEERFKIIPQPRAFMWGNHSPVEVEPRRSLVDFISKARDRGISIGLSSWFNDDMTHRRDEIVTPEDYARIWHETLEFLDAEGFHDAIEWVDLCNEFPLGDWAGPAHIRIFDAPGRDPVPSLGIWTPTQIERINSYFAAIEALRADWPELAYTFSFSTVPPNVFALDLSHFDLLEAHCWITTTDIEFVGATRFIDFLSMLPEAVTRHVQLADQTYWPRRDEWLSRLELMINLWSQRACDAGLPIINSEGWASTIYEDAPLPGGRDPWDYVRDVGRSAVAAAVSAGYWGVCTSNFSQPHFPGLWSDVAWHKELNELIGYSPATSSLRKPPSDTRTSCQ